MTGTGSTVTPIRPDEVRGWADDRIIMIPDVPGFYYGERAEHWERIGLDCTMAIDRRHDFERKQTSGTDDIDLRGYVV